MYKEWRPTTRYIVGAGLFLFGLVILYFSRSIIPLLIIASLIAFLVRPLIKTLCVRLKVPRSVAVLITYLLVAIVIVLAPLILLPPIINAVNFLLELDYQLLVADSLHWLRETLLLWKENDFRLLGVSIILDSAIDPILLATQDAGSVMTPEMPSFSVIINSVGQAFALSYGVAVGVVGTLFSGIMAFVFMIISSIYLSVDGAKFVDRFVNSVPVEYRTEVAHLLDRLTVIWDSFFRGQLLLMVIMGTAVWSGLTILGLPGAFALGIIAGILEIIPNLGPFFAAFPAVIVALLQGSDHFALNNFIFALIIIGFYVFIQFIENSILVPRILGVSVKIHPVVVILGVLVGASVWGILGALLAAPVIATGREIFFYLYFRVLGENPFPPGEDSPPERKQTPLRGLFPDLSIKGRKISAREDDPDQPEGENPQPEPTDE